MSLSCERHQSVFELLQGLRGLDPLKELFWSELNYERVNRPLSRRGWTDTAAGALAEDPILFAGGGQDSAFHVIYARLASDRLLLSPERPVVSRLLRDHPYALFVFSNSAQDRWHFLNVKYDDKSEKRRLFRRITVGPEERLRTASERLSLLDLESVSPDLFGLSPLTIQQRHDDAFDVEAVTDEFFKQYRRVFEHVEQLIKGFSEPERRRLFTQRLFNRLMFIAFIQKKGWLKFDSQTDYLSALWRAYEQDNDPEKNFYRNRLELLFFHGLNTPNEVNIVGINRGGFLKTLIGDVPYLNGGLFEQDEDDRNDKLAVPDAAVNAILHELFDRFNFTVTESTPLDVEVAVDPEMLGKVFEELVTSRHETGSYYTPKPVVSFMGREALKGYLETALSGESPEAVQQFVEERDPARLRNPEAVLEALRRVRVCDPACGSGAYLLGMLHELLDLRACLFATRNLDPLSTYERKLEIIQNNLYGVDIDPFAVNIARLRLWLSLAVDFEGDHPPPLPNLDFKIEVGDSLTAPDTRGHELRGEQIRLYREAKACFLTAHGGQKKTLLKEIATLKGKIARWTHAGNPVVGFDWPVEFAEVIADGGFDIALANPPYVRQELIKPLKPTLKNVYPDVYSGTADLYCYFYARALELLRPGGMLTFISSNKWFRAAYGANLRKHITGTCHVRSITDFGELPVFQTAATFPMIFVAQKRPTPRPPPDTGGGGAIEKETERPACVFTQVKSLDPPYPDVTAIIRESGQALPPDALNGSNWTLTDAASASRLRRMEAASISLGEYVKGQIYYGIKTGFNTAFVIDGAKWAELIKEDRRNREIIKPLVVGDDVRKWHIDYQDRWLIFTRRGIHIDVYPTIKKHLAQWRKHLEPKPRTWPANKDWPGRKPGSYKWYEIQDEVAYYTLFEKPKIVFPDIAKEPRFAFDVNNLYINNTTYFISSSDLYLVGVLNSSIIWNYCKERLTVLGDADKGGRLRFFRQFVQELPIPNALAADRAAIAALAQKCLDAKGVGCEKWEREIDERVAGLYGL